VRRLQGGETIACENGDRLLLPNLGPGMLSESDLRDLEKCARAQKSGWQQAAIDALAAKHGLEPRAWMDWRTDNGSILFAELAKDAHGHAYDGFWAFALGDFWKTANEYERDKLLNCIVESLHILLNERNANPDQAHKMRFENQAVETVIRFLGVYADKDVKAALAALDLKLKGRLEEIVKKAAAADFRRREGAFLQAFISEQSAP